MTNMEKVIELLKNEDFVKKVAACGDQNDVIELFKNNGVAITSTELENIGKTLQAAEDNDGELPDELAEKVAGGFSNGNDTGGIDIEHPSEVIDYAFRLLLKHKDEVLKALGKTTDPFKNTNSTTNGNNTTADGQA